MGKIYIGSDHAGFELKQEILSHFASKSMEDLGCPSLHSVDYPDYAVKVAHAVAADQGSFGILVCGTGIGVSIAANKCRGIRAAVCRTEFEAEVSRQHNDANIICIGARTTTTNVVLRLVAHFLRLDFEGGRHGRRVDKINALDQQPDLGSG